MNQVPNFEAIPEETVIKTGESARQFLQNAMMKIIREMPSEYRDMSEETQDRFITRVCAICEHVSKEIVRHLATDGRQVVPTTIESVQVKGGLKILLSAKSTSDNIASVTNEQGSWCYLMTYAEKNNLDAVRVPGVTEDRMAEWRAPYNLTYNVAGWARKHHI